MQDMNEPSEGGADHRTDEAQTASEVPAPEVVATVAAPDKIAPIEASEAATSVPETANTDAPIALDPPGDAPFVATTGADVDPTIAPADALPVALPVDGVVPAAPPAPPARPMDMATFLRAMAVLFTVGASLGGFFAQLTVLAQLDTLITKNDMPNRFRVEASMAGTGFVFALIALVYIGLGRRAKATEKVADRVDSLHRFAVFLLPLTMAALVPPLFRWLPWSTLELELLVILGLLGFTLEQLVRLSLTSVPAVLSRLGDRLSARFSGRFSRWAPPIFVGFLALGYAVFASVFTLFHHYQFGTACWDLGLYDNLFYNAAHGHPFRMTPLSGDTDWASLRSHAEVGMYFLLPFYSIHASSDALLIIQSVMLGTSAIPLYLFSLRFVPRGTALCLAIAYVLYAPLHRSNFYDFHLQPIAAVYTHWMLYFFISRRNVLFWIMFFLALTAREDISVGLAAFGTLLMVSGYRFRVGLVVTLLSIAYFAIVKGVIMPLAGGWWFADIYKLLQIPGKKGYGSIIETLVSNPIYVLTTLVTKDKLIFTLQILLPLAMLPLRRSYLALSIFPGFFFTLLTTGYNPTVTTLFQYNMYWVSYIFPASAIALRVLSGQSARPDDDTTPAADASGVIRRRAALVSMLFLTVVTSYHFGAVLQQKNFKSGFASKIGFGLSADGWKRYRDMREVAQLIPQDAKLAATERVAPHVSARVSLYCFRDSIGQGDWIFYAGLDKNGKNNKVIRELLQARKFGVVAEKGDFILLKKGADTTRNAEIEKRLQ